MDLFAGKTQPVMLPSYRNQSEDLDRKPIDWFLFDWKIAMKKVNGNSTGI